MKRILRLYAVPFFILGTLALVATQASAGHWVWCADYTGNRSYYSYDMIWLNSSGYTCNWSWQGVWTGSCTGGGGNTLSYAHCSECMRPPNPLANADTTGIITVTHTWVPDGSESPPESIWLWEETSAYWRVTSGSFTPVATKYNVFSSLPGSYYVDDDVGTQQIGGQARIGYLMPLTSSRYGYWIRVDSPPNTFTRTARLAASVEGYSTEGVGTVLVECRFASTVGRGLETQPPPNEMPLARVPLYWAGESSTFYPVKPRSNPQKGATQTGGDPVNLATGAHAYLPAADITVYNPLGPSVEYQLNFHTGRARDGYASPGLSAGWVDNFDAKIEPVSGSGWRGLELTYPNGSKEVLGYPTGAGNPVDFIRPTGAPYVAKGTKGTPYQWESLEITWKDETKWTFAPCGTDVYRLTRITNRMGSYISIVRDSGNGYRVASVTDDSSTPNTLLSFSYPSGHLDSLTDCYSRKITYTYGSAAGTTCLLAVSQISPSGMSNPPAHWTYGYQSIYGQPHLTSVSFPIPAGSGASTQSVEYDTSTGSFSSGKVTALVDANQNRTEFSYESNGYTKVQVKNPQSVVEKEWTQSFDPTHGNVDTGTADAKGHCTGLVYGNSNNPSLPTKVFDKIGKETVFTYGPYGNITNIKDPRGTSTVYDYQYDVFPLGQLASIREGTKTATTFTYYAPSGLVHEIISPKPGTTGPTGETVSTYYDYDTLGNITMVDAPGNNAVSRIVTRYDYGSTPKLGQPLTITTNLGSPRYFQYDEYGNVTSVKDALNHETNFTYNLADQPLAVIYPSTAPPP